MRRWVRISAAVLAGCVLAVVPAQAQQGAGGSADSAQSRSGDRAYVEELIRRAEQGEAYAQSRLGARYYLGQGVPQNYWEAARWYRLAAEQGEASAQFNLGLMYRRGQGVPQSFVEAYMWLNLAAASGDEGARTARDRVMRDMTPAQIAEGQRRAAEWRPTTPRAGSEPGR